MGMEASLKVTVTLSSGRKFVNETLCYWCRGWNISREIFKILGKDADESVECYKVNRSSLQEIKDFLISSCNDLDSIEEYDYWSDPGHYISARYNDAAEIQKIQMLRDKKLPLYAVFPDECENSYDPDDNVIDISVEFIYSP